MLTWCSSQHDPGQLHNLIAAGKHHRSDSEVAEPVFVNGHRLSLLVSHLDALMMVLKSCKADSCLLPWHQLHPEGNVNSFADALDTSYDAFYHAQPRVSFSACELGYIPESEGPMQILPFPLSLAMDDTSGPAQVPLVNPDWSMWVEGGRGR